MVKLSARERSFVQRYERAVQEGQKAAKQAAKRERQLLKALRDATDAMHEAQMQRRRMEDTYNRRLQVDHTGAFTGPDGRIFKTH